MIPQEKALQLYNDAYSRWATELSHDKNKLIAKSIATYVCDEILNHHSQEQGLYRIDTYYWQQIKQEIEKL